METQAAISPDTASINSKKFGTFAGVFVPTVLTILGAIMYLRLGWVVGNAGLGGALLVILLAHVITISTGLAVASIATNIRVGAGGAFSIISQSLGLEVGGSVSIPLYLAQGISTALYVFAFTEGVISLFDNPPGWLSPLIVFATFFLVFGIAYISAQLAARIQFIILAVVGFSLFSVFLGSFAIGSNIGLVQTPVLWGNFSDGGFWVIFSVFFPAVTGIMAGISLSGDLKNPRESIPKGTLGAVAVTFLIYVLLAFWLAGVATSEELLDLNQIVMADKAYFSWAVIAGILGATFSSALGSLIAAPRVMQALGQHRILPYSKELAQETAAGEPRRAMLVTGVIVIVAMIFALIGGGLNAIAPLITMFFLVTYGMLNAVVLIEQTLGMVSFRPTFAIPRIVPLIGLVGCLFVMFLINPVFSLISIIFTLALYAYLQRQHLKAPWGDVRSGLFMGLAEWAAVRVSRMPAATERTWSPNILAPVTTTKMLTGSYRFLRAIASPQGSVHALGVYRPGQKKRIELLGELTAAFTKDGIYARMTTLEDNDFAAGVGSAIEVMSGVFFRPNILFIPLFVDEHIIDLERLMVKSIENKIGVVFLARHPVIELGREQEINVWVREQGPKWELGLRLSNLDLSVLLAYQLARNWGGRISLCMTVNDQATYDKAEQFLKELISLGRLPRGTRYIIKQGSFREALVEVPHGDINLFGLPGEFDRQFLETVFEIVDASCLFIRDSGNESALA
ncbi:MAG: amino acid permease [Candidatus Promineifilaceae bacterium]